MSGPDKLHNRARHEHLTSMPPEPAGADGRSPPLLWPWRGTWRLGLITSAVWIVLILRLRAEHPWAIPGYLTVATGAAALAAIDQRSHLLPNRLTYPLFAAAVVLLGAAATLEGEPARAIRALGAAGAAAVALLPLARYGNMGLGDVKFAVTLAAALGWLSWPALLTGAVAAFMLAGVAVATTIVVRSRPGDTPIAFGPWLALGALAGVLT